MVRASPPCTALTAGSVVALLTAVHRVVGHGALNRPFPRTSTSNTKTYPPDLKQHPGCLGGACMYYSIGCVIGCDCNGEGPVGVGYGADPQNSSSVGCDHLMEPTLDKRMRTWNLNSSSARGDWTKYNPWSAPGHCKPLDPCGMWWGRPNITDLRPPGTPSRGSEFPPLDTPPVVWNSGGRAEVGFSLAVNHGGGYQYRLCPVEEKLTDECFEGTPLAFASHKTTLHWERGERPDLTVPAFDVSDGVKPKGSTWRRMPVPAEACDYGDYCHEHGDDCDGKQFPLSCLSYPGALAQFPEPAPGVRAYSLSAEELKLSILDTIVVPTRPGRYVLGFRWDCDQSDQVWNSLESKKLASTVILAPTVPTAVRSSRALATPPRSRPAVTSTRASMRSSTPPRQSTARGRGRRPATPTTSPAQGARGCHSPS